MQAVRKPRVKVFFRGLRKVAFKIFTNIMGKHRMGKFLRSETLDDRFLSHVKSAGCSAGLGIMKLTSHHEHRSFVIPKKAHTQSNPKQIHLFSCSILTSAVCFMLPFVNISIFRNITPSDTLFLLLRHL